jgi:hypothetical protein
MQSYSRDDKLILQTSIRFSNYYALSRLIDVNSNMLKRCLTTRSGVLNTHRFASTLVLASHDGKTLDASTLNAVTAATKIGGNVSVLVAGSASLAQAAQKIAGVTQV